MTHWIWQHTDWPHFSWQEDKVLSALSEARLHQGRIMGSTRLLDRSLSQEAQIQILIEDGFNTSAIEGEKIDIETLRSSVARRLGLSTSGLRATPRAVDGLIELLLDATNNYAKPLTLPRLCGWQAALFPSGYSGLYKIRTGSLRGKEPMRVVSGPFEREQIHYEAPPGTHLKKEMSVFIKWFNDKNYKMDGLIRAGIAHLWFVAIHPFEDGNGRITRAITDMAIAQDEKNPMRLFSLSSQIMKNRKEYYEILERTTRNGMDITAWLLWYLNQVTQACMLAEFTLKRILEKARFWIHHQHTNLNARQRKALNRLLDASAVEFEKGINTRIYMNLTKTSRATAYRELNELVQCGCLQPVGSGRAARYILILNKN